MNREAAQKALELLALLDALANSKLRQEFIDNFNPDFGTASFDSVYRALNEQRFNLERAVRK